MHVAVGGVEGDQRVPASYFDEGGGVYEGEVVVGEEAEGPVACGCGEEFDTAEFCDGALVDGGVG